ncbi:MAG: YraN family protein [Thermoleophilia bacterium]|nr:YraN family protein [Thermoleophilia bacterium]
MNRHLRAFLNRMLGDRGERAAARHLKRNGYRVITRGFKAAKGEIDLIARDGPTLVFVEVKTRRAGVPAEAVTREKQRRLALAALEFTRRFGLDGVPARFDVVAIVWPDDDQAPAVELIRDAFPAPDLGHFRA